MRPLRIFLAFMVICVFGCRNLNRDDRSYREVRIENTVAVKITSVRIGAADHCSDFGILGSKGAGKAAGVPVRFESAFPIEWEEKFNNIWHRAAVDLRRFKDTENRAIILRYTGDGKWEALPGREIPRRTDK